MAMGRDVDPDADDVLEERALGELALNEVAFAFGEIEERGRLGEHLLEDAEPYRRLVVRRRHEQAPARIDVEAVEGGGVQIREEDQHVVLLLVPRKVLDERRTPGTLLLEPFELV